MLVKLPNSVTIIHSELQGKYTCLSCLARRLSKPYTYEYCYSDILFFFLLKDAYKGEQVKYLTYLSVHTLWMTPNSFSLGNHTTSSFLYKNYYAELYTNLDQVSNPPLPSFAKYLLHLL